MAAAAADHDAFGGFRVHLDFGGWAGLARSKRSSRGARSKRRMIAFISSCVRGIDKCEALGFLSFGIADDLNSVGHQTFGGQPRPDIVCGHPYGEVSEKYGKAHSYCCFLLRGD